jgi:hypothetical protein
VDVKKKPSPPLSIKSVKAHGYSPAYEARLIRGIRKARKSGKKPTRQSARGHKKAEHIERKQKELAKNKITGSQIEAVKSFLRRFNNPLYKGVPDEADLVNFIRNEGYPRFVEYRKTWDKYRTEYLGAQRRGELGAKGSLGYNMDEIVAQAGVAPRGDDKWLYYH